MIAFTTTSTPTGNGFAVIKREGGNLSTEISLKEGLPNTTYHVRLIQTPGGADCLVFDTTLTTNGQGNGNVHFSEALMSGTTDAFVDLSSMGIAGDFYNTPDVTLG